MTTLQYYRFSEELRKRGELEQPRTPPSMIHNGPNLQLRVRLDKPIVLFNLYGDVQPNICINFHEIFYFIVNESGYFMRVNAEYPHELQKLIRLIPKQYHWLTTLENNILSVVPWEEAKSHEFGLL